MFKDPRKWITAAVLAVAFAISFPAIYFRQESKSKISVQTNLVSLIKQVEPSVVYVEACDYEGNVMWSGSGVIIDSNGLILTAAHIVNGADKFKIVLPDSREFYSGISFCKSELTDVGFIRIDVENLPFSYLGNSDNLCKGERVFMIGSPFDLRFRNTITAGIISGLNRNIEIFGVFPILQFDIHNFSGMSGCPIYNLKGQVIGVHAGGRLSSCGMGVGIPVNVIKEILDIYEAEKELENAS